MFLCTPWLERTSHIVTWPFSMPVKAWSHFFSFPPDKQSFLIELKTVLLRPSETHKTTVMIDPTTVIRNIKIDQVDKLATELNLDEKEKNALRQVLQKFIRMRARKKLECSIRVVRNDCQSNHLFIRKNDLPTRSRLRWKKLQLQPRQQRVYLF